MEEQKRFQELVDIIEQLRGENGCPWDREQTLNSLKPCIMEEAAEVCAAIRIYDKTNNYENLREELGDLLLQVVMQSQIAKEENLFAIEDVIEEISEKMIRRHPHVFGTAQADTSTEVLKNWEEIKKKEKEEKTWIKTPLTEIPKELPALTRAEKVQKKINKLYEEQPSAKQSVQKMKKQVEELERSLDDKRQTEELLGEMLLQICNLAQVQKIQAEQVLTEEIERQIDKYEGNM